MNQETRIHLNQLETFHALIVSVLPATTRSPTRIKIFSPRFKDSVIIEYNGDNGVSFEQGIIYLESKGYNVIGQADYNSGFIIISDTFKALTTKNQEQPAPAQTPAEEPVKAPEERGYNNELLSKHLAKLNIKWIKLKDRGLLHSIEPNTPNKIKEGYPVRLMIIDALANVMCGSASESLIYTYHYKTEAEAEQDVQKLNTETPHGIYLTSF